MILPFPGAGKTTHDFQESKAFTIKENMNGEPLGRYMLIYEAQPKTSFKEARQHLNSDSAYLSDSNIPNFLR